jgi:hypothetical protein
VQKDSAANFVSETAKKGGSVVGVAAMSAMGEAGAA